MSQTVLSKGKNIMEAIELGLNLLGTKKEEVSIEVIQQENKGFLRLGSKQAVVKLTKILTPQNRNENPSFVTPSSIEDMVKLLDTSDLNEKSLTDKRIQSVEDLEFPFTEELEGKVWVKDGLIFCQPSRLHYPTISVGKGVKLLKNNEIISGTTIATEEDQFEIQLEEETKDTQWNITLDSSKLHVRLHVEPGMKRTYELKDIQPDFHIILEAKEVIEINNELQYKQLLEELENLRVIHGFNHSEIMRAVNSEFSGQFVVASGIEPKPGEHGRLELIVDLENKSGLKERTNGTVDFREVKVIPTVQKGQVIAIVHPPIPGTIGYTVTNDPLPPAPTYPLIVKAEKGITLIENDTKIVATETGRPVIEQRGLMVNVSIMEKLVHPGDVNITSGNIRFRGDVDIIGNVEDGMVVEAEGEIHIFKNVFSSSICSNQSISIKGNAIGSTISAGKQNIFASEMVHLLSNIHEEQKKMLLSVQQIMKLPAFKTSDVSKKGLLPLIKLLVEQKFKGFLIYVKQFIDLSKKGSQILDIEWLTLAEQLRLCYLTSIVNEFHTVEKMRGLVDKMEYMIEKHQVENDQKSVIKLMYALNSTIYSAGDVFIQGQGCYNTKIHSGGQLTINGVYRGGELYAREGVYIKEVGSEGGVISKIVVPSNGTIKIDLAREGTQIQIGKIKHTFHSEQRYIFAKLDKNEKLIF